MKTISFVLAFSICALLNFCKTDAQALNETSCGSTPCMNGGKCLTGGDLGSTYCDCTGTGYTGYDCREKIDTNDTSCHCYNGGSCVMLNANGSEWRCDCAHTGYTGKYCEIFDVENMTSPCSYMICYNGGKCYTDDYYSYCDCNGTGYVGSDCSYSTTCYNTTCFNGGQCLRHEMHDYEFCDCTGTDYGGNDCGTRNNQTACGNGTCFNGGRCIHQGYYIGINYEYCDCTGTGYGGEYCDTVPVSVCDGYCANGGVCSETFGIPFCACPPGLGGPRCEMHDPTNYCRTAGPNDVEFLPLCTLRNTTEQLVDCVVHNMAGVAFGAMGNGTCLHGIHQTFTCVGNVIGNCSRSTCPSIYHLPGVGETVKMIVEGMFSPEVMYTISQYVCSPIPAGGYVQFLGDIPDVNLAPICPSVTLNDMVDILRVLENGLLFGSQDLSSICRVISQAQDMAYQLSTRCDMSGVISLLPPGYEVLGPYIQRGFNAIQNMLSNYTFPFCRGVDPGPAPGMCPMITYQSSQCEMVDAWMCQQFMRRKELSSWMEEFMVWWRTCSGFAERDWDHWASSMGLRRGDMYGGYGTSMGEDGFVRVIKANHQCTSYSSMDCYDGWTFTDVLGCTHCYRRGTTGRNTRSLFMMWMDDYQEYMTTMKIYNALRQDCTGSFTGGCSGGGRGGVPPTMPPYGTTPNTGSPWPWATTTMPYPYPEGTTSPQWPWASSSTPQWPWASSSTSQWPWPWTTASMPHPYPEETTGSVPQWPGATPTTPHAYPEESTDSGP